MTFDFGQAPEPTQQQVAAAFSDDPAAMFEQIRQKQQARAVTYDVNLISEPVDPATLTLLNPELNYRPESKEGAK